MQLLLKCHLFFYQPFSDNLAILLNSQLYFRAFVFFSFFLARFGKTSALKLTIVDYHNPEMLVSGDRGERASNNDKKKTTTI